MAATPEMAPSRTRRSSAAANGNRSGSRANRDRKDDENLEAQIARLQDDLKSIAASIASLADEKVTDARGAAKREARHLVRASQHAVEEVADEFGHMEKQIKDTIREKPLTAVAGAIALGFLLAVISR
ncbi:MAG: hypothetical protein Q8L54_03130 [Devosia sp.]|nr:hypothetical protein [Devosia sp.]